MTFDFYGTIGVINVLHSPRRETARVAEILALSTAKIHSDYQTFLPSCTGQVGFSFRIRQINTSIMSANI